MQETKQRRTSKIRRIKQRAAIRKQTSKHVCSNQSKHEKDKNKASQQTCMKKVRKAAREGIKKERKN